MQVGGTGIETVFANRGVEHKEKDASVRKFTLFLFVGVSGNAGIGISLKGREIKTRIVCI